MDILQMSFSASVMIVAVVMIRALTLHRLPKRTFIALWGVVICRLLIPFSIPYRFSFYTGLELIKQMLSAQTATSVVSAPVVITGGTNIAELPAAGEVMPSVPAATAAVSPIFVAWLVGMCVFTLIFIIVYLKCRREFKTSLPVQNDFAMRWLREHALRRTVQMCQSDRIQAPLTYGVFRPVILLPKAIDWTDEAGLKVILAHELTHIRRFDALTKLVLVTAMCVHWFNPVVWVMYVLANRDIELSCDEAVVRSFGETMKSTYAMTLIGWEERKSSLAPLISGFSKNAIEERITAIMKIKKYSTPVIIVAVLLVVGLSVGFATSSAKADNSGLQNDAGVLTSTSPSPDSAVSNDIVNSSKTAADDWVWPVEGCDTVTSMFGKRVHPISGTTTENDHICISGDNADGAKVYAALAGTVLETGFEAEQGNYIIITHDNGIETSYRHLKEILVMDGDPVAAGDTIGTVGKTGTATGPCLGFCVYVNGAALNPLDYYTTVPVGMSDTPPTASPGSNTVTAEPTGSTANENTVSQAPVPASKNTDNAAENIVYDGYPVNQYGWTYGNASMREALGLNYAPYLMEAVGTEGQSGYIKTKNRESNMPSAPDEYHTIALFDVDGYVIGAFVLSSSNAVENGAYISAAQEPSYPRNSKGETYGNNSLAQALGYEPDLVAALGTEGQSGYIRERDIPGADVSNPEEAAEYMEWRKTQPSIIMIPLYDQEGDVIGTFGVSNSPSVDYDSLEEARKAVAKGE